MLKASVSHKCLFVDGTAGSERTVGLKGKDEDIEFRVLTSTSKASG